MKVVVGGNVLQLQLPALFFRLGLFQANHPAAIGPLATLAEQVHALKALEDGAIFFTAASGGFETVVLRHD